MLPLDLLSRDIDEDQTVKCDMKARIYCEERGGDRMRPCRDVSEAAGRRWAGPLKPEQQE